MIIYNITINVDDKIHEKWVNWMQNVHIPEVLSTGKFLKALMTRVLVNEEMGGVSYSIQYTCESRQLLDLYYQEDAERLRKEGLKLFGQQFVSFRTELEIIDEYKVAFD